MFSAPFARPADINHHRGILRSQFFRQHRGADPFRGPDQIGPLRQSFHTITQIALNVIEADPSQSQCGLLLSSRLGNDHNGPGGVQEGASPRRVLAAQPDVDTARHVSLGILRRVANIQNLRPAVAHL